MLDLTGLEQPENTTCFYGSLRSLWYLCSVNTVAHELGRLVLYVLVCGMLDQYEHRWWDQRPILGYPPLSGHGCSHPQERMGREDPPKQIKSQVNSMVWWVASGKVVWEIKILLFLSTIFVMRYFVLLVTVLRSVKVLLLECYFVGVQLTFLKHSAILECQNHWIHKTLRCHPYLILAFRLITLAYILKR